MMQRFKNRQKDQLVFSSEDSLNSNNSFASSVDEEDQEDFANHFLNMKDQMEHFLSQNPQLEEALKFEPFKEGASSEEEEDHTTLGNQHLNKGGQNTQTSLKKKNLYKGPKIEHRKLEDLDRKNKGSDTSSSSESNRSNSVDLGKKKKSNEKSKLWSSLTKDVVRMGQFGCKTPTLETVNHRLNIFKTKIEKIDYLDYLQKEMTQTAGGLILQQQQQQQGKDTNQAGPEKQSTQQQLGTTNNMINSQQVGPAQVTGIAGPQQNANAGSINPKGEGQEQNQNSNSSANAKQGEQEEEDNSGRDNDGNIVYFSFKKRLQLNLQHKIERNTILKKEEQALRKKEAKYMTGSGGRRANMVARGAIDAKKLINEQELQEKKRQANYDYIKKEAKVKRKSFTGLKAEESSNDEQGQNTEKDTTLNFQTRVGIALHQTYQQCAGDKESFKKTANFILKDYNKTKQQFFKKKQFPPQITKFTNEETKSLNVYLPDFSSGLYAPNKNNLFANIDQFELPQGTPEGDFMQVVDKILDGAVLRFWKESQNQQQ